MLLILSAGLMIGSALTLILRRDTQGFQPGSVVSQDSILGNTHQFFAVLIGAQQRAYLIGQEQFRYITQITGTQFTGFHLAFTGQNTLHQLIRTHF